MAEILWSRITSQQWDWIEGVYREFGLIPDAAPDKARHIDIQEPRSEASREELSGERSL
jgi:hypothetical protein